MYKIRISFILCGLFLLTLLTYASHRIYVIHGWGSYGYRMEFIHKTLTKNGFNSEIFTYPSLSRDIDSVGNELFLKIKNESVDSVSFITYSMGALVVRSMYEHLKNNDNFPFIYRFVMMAPPNKGTPVADFCASFKFIKPLLGPNVDHMTTNPASLSNRLPVPTCEVGLIVGIRDRKKGYNPFMTEDNDGLVSLELARLGNEKDICFVKSYHSVVVMERVAMKQILSFIRYGSFTK